LKYDVKVDFVGFDISSEFVVGYGMDVVIKFYNFYHINRKFLIIKDEWGRNLPDIWISK
jgi:hypothetical protein